MIKVAHYTVSFHRNGLTGIKIARIAVDPDSCNAQTFPQSCYAFHAALRSSANGISAWTRDAEHEIDVAKGVDPAPLADDMMDTAWQENLPDGIDAKIAFSDLLDAVLKPIFPGASVTAETTADGRKVLALYAKSALPLNNPDAQASAAQRFQGDPAASSSLGSGTSGKRMRMNRNNALKSWF